MEHSLNSLLATHGAELRRAVRNQRFELAENGLLFPDQKLTIGGVFSVSVNDGPVDAGFNRIPDPTLDYIIDLILHGAAQTPTWYVALFAGNVTPAANLTAATFSAACTEFVNYTETTRQEYVESASASQAASNAASLASFTIDTGGGSVYGAALLSSSAKGGTTGRLLAAARFATAPKLVDAGDSLKAQYTFGAQSA